MEFKKFNVEYTRDCQRRDYLFVGKIQKYTKVNSDKNVVLYFCIQLKVLFLQIFILDISVWNRNSIKLHTHIKESRDGSEIPFKRQSDQGWLQNQNNW